MFCPKCGYPVNSGDRFCGACGIALANQTETVVHSFGPFGTGVCFSRPGFFTVIQKNDTKIVVTDRRIYGESTLSGSLRFNVPYTVVAAAETFGYLLWKVLWLRYSEAGKTKEVSIMGTPSNGENIAWTQSYIQSKLQPRR